MQEDWPEAMPYFRMLIARAATMIARVRLAADSRSISIFAQRLRGIGAAPGYTLHVFFITPFANNARVCQGFSIRPVINPGAVSLSP